MKIEVTNLSFSYGNHKVLEHVSFHADQGMFLSVLGPNGVGKSTLFKCLLGILRPNTGNIILDGQNIQKLTPKQLAEKIAYIPQLHHQDLPYTVLDMVLMGTAAGLRKFCSPGNTEVAEAEQALNRLGFLHLKDRSYAHISGGERQLVLIARALVQKARILVMDEPSSSLDFGNRIKVMQTMQALSKEDYLVIQSTHDPDQAFLYSDRIFALHEGQVLAYGTPSKVITPELISKLYNIEVEICSLHDDEIRFCLPANRKFYE